MLLANQRNPLRDISFSLALFLLVATSVSAQPASGRQTLGPLEQLNTSLQTVVTKALPAIVQVEVIGYGPLKDDDENSGTRLLAKTETAASGVILDSHGYIVTNAHVVRGATRILVVLDERAGPVSAQSKGREDTTFEARIIGTFEQGDLAVLKIEAQDLPTLAVADPDSIKPGQLVLALGNPSGLVDSVSIGVVSAVARQDEPDSPVTYIQTDAAINAGSSGGALVDVHGDLLGIITFIRTESGGNEGLGFALPSGTVRKIFEELKTNGRVRIGDIGVKIQALTPTMGKGLHLSRERGLIVCDVTPDSPAEHAGVRVQDIVLAVDENRTESLPQFLTSFYFKHGGDHVTLKLLRGSRQISTQVAIRDSTDESKDLIEGLGTMNGVMPTLGIVGVSLNRKARSVIQGLRSDSGVIVAAKLDHSDSRTDLEPGDLIRSVNGEKVNTIEELRSIIQRFRSGDAVVLQLERRGELRYTAFELDPGGQRAGK